jgi:hypothetical protein
LTQSVGLSEDALQGLYSLYDHDNDLEELLWTLLDYSERNRGAVDIASEGPVAGQATHSARLALGAPEDAMDMVRPGLGGGCLAGGGWVQDHVRVGPGCQLLYGEGVSRQAAVGVRKHVPWVSHRGRWPVGRASRVSAARFAGLMLHLAALQLTLATGVER